jgi:hypothetical protein
MTSILNYLREHQTCIIIGPPSSGKTTLCKKTFVKYNYKSIETTDKTVLNHLSRSVSLVDMFSGKSKHPKHVLFLDALETYPAIHTKHIYELCKYANSLKIPAVITTSNGRNIPSFMKKIYKNHQYSESDKDTFYPVPYKCANEIFQRWVERKPVDERMMGNDYIITGFLFDEYPKFCRDDLSSLERASEVFSYTDLFERKNGFRVDGQLLDNAKYMKLFELTQLLSGGREYYKMKHYFPKYIISRKDPTNKTEEKLSVKTKKVPPPKCQYTLNRGKRKGQLCGKSSIHKKGDLHLCKTHFKKV